MIIELIGSVRRLVRDNFFVPAEHPFPDSAPTFSSGTDRVSLRVLSQNVWNLPIPLLTKCPEERAAAIASWLRREGAGDQWDVVVFQEAWHTRERDMLRQAGVKAGLKYSHSFEQGIGFLLWPSWMGSGIVVLSRYPIVETMYHRFSVNGKPYKMAHCDYLGAKGVGLARIALPPPFDTVVNVYATHLHASYVQHTGMKPLKVSSPVALPDIFGRLRHHISHLSPARHHDPLAQEDDYIVHRVAQSFELSQFIRSTARGRYAPNSKRSAPSLTVMCGDLNAPPKSVFTQLPIELASLVDAFACVRPSEPGFTFGTADNPWSAHEQVQRIDYIMFRRHDTIDPLHDDLAWSIQDSSVVKVLFEGQHGKNTPISDHFGVSATFELAPVARPKGAAQQTAESQLTPKRPESCLPETAVPPCLDSAFEVIAAGIADVKKRRGNHFIFASLAGLVAIASLIVVSLHGLEVLRLSNWVHHSCGAFVAIGFVFGTLQYLLGQFVCNEELQSLSDISNDMRVLRHAIATSSSTK